MPTDSLWLKLGGDKGRGSFKMNLQLCNLLHPNSQKCTNLLSMFMAEDSTTNLHTCLDMYAEQLSELQGMTMSGRKISIFVSGDYEFLCRIYGLTGASGRHCCLWCHIISANLKVPLSTRGRLPERSLDTLDRDYHKFMTDGEGNLKVAKLYNNVIAPTILKVPLDQVCFPGLHLSLGIFDRLWNLLEQACTELDLHLAVIKKNPENRDSRSTFDRYTAALHRLSELQTRLDAEKQTTSLLDQLVTFFSVTLANASTNCSLQRLRSQAKKAWEAVHTTELEIKSVNAIISQKFDCKDGPFYQCLSTSLRELHVDKQAYHGGTFVGNHVNKLLKKSSIEVLIGRVRSEAESRGMKAMTDTICSNFYAAMTNFANCHKGYSGGAMDDKDIDQLEKDIEKFLSHYRSQFPHATILPKMHILEDHVIPWLRKWHVGAGIMGEQGAESLHAHLHHLENNFCGIPNHLERLKYIFKTYSLETCPQLLELRPPIKKRKEEA